MMRLVKVHVICESDDEELTLDLGHVPTLLLIEVDTDLDLALDVLAAPHELVAVKDGSWADGLLDSLGLPNGADGTTLLHARADHDIVLVDVLQREGLNVKAVEPNLGSHAKLGWSRAWRHALGDLRAANGAPGAHAEIEVESLRIDNDSGRVGVALVGGGLGVGIAVVATKV